MGRAERRKQERFLKKKGTPVSHLHSHYLPSELDSMRSEIKEFFKIELLDETWELSPYSLILELLI